LRRTQKGIFPLPAGLAAAFDGKAIRTLHKTFDIRRRPAAVAGQAEPGNIVNGKSRTMA
jgi:hypothetical protein